MIDDAGPRIGNAKPCKQRELRGLGDLESVRRRPVDDRDVARLDEANVVKGGVDGMGVAAQIGRRAHAVHKQRESGRPRRIPRERARIYLDKVYAATGQRSKQGLKPLGMFVQDSDSHEQKPRAGPGMRNPAPRP